MEDNIRIVEVGLEELSSASNEDCPAHVGCGDDCTCPNDPD